MLEGASRARLHAWLEQHRLVYPWVYFPEEAESAERNAHCYPVVFAGEELVAYIKLGLGKVFVHEFELELGFPDGAAFVYDTFVDPRFRGQGLGTALIRACVDWFSARGGRTVLCHIEDWNTASLHAFSRAGFQRVGSLEFTRILGFRRWRTGNRVLDRKALERWLACQAGAPESC